MLPALLRLALPLLLLSLVASPAGAAIFLVDSTVDEPDAVLRDGICAAASGACTLRAAVSEANSVFGPDEIVLGPGVHVLSIAWRGDLDVSDSLTIRGAGRDVTQIDGGGLDRVLDARFAGNTGAPELRLEDLTVTGGFERPGEEGAGLRVFSGSVVLLRVAVVGNQGAGVVLEGEGLFGSSGTANVAVDIRDSALSGNAGSGLIVRAAIGTIVGSEISDNGGWGVRAEAVPPVRSDLIYDGCLVSGNALGGIEFGETRDIVVRTRVTGNRGPGLSFTTLDDAGPYEIRDSEISFNDAVEGAGLRVEGTVRVVGSTISGNSAVRGGGIYVGENASLALRFTTVTGNRAEQGGGLIAHVDSFNSIFATALTGNAAPGSADCAVLGPSAYATAITSLGYAVVGDVEGCVFAAGPGDQPGVLDPLLFPLVPNGGPTWTHRTMPGSPLLDAVPLAACAFDQDFLPSTPDAVIPDQRGVARPQGEGCDIGAYEEAPACADGIDNDDDGLVDHPTDPGCASPASAGELGWPSGGPTCGIGPELLALAPLLAWARARRRRT